MRRSQKIIFLLTVLTISNPNIISLAMSTIQAGKAAASRRGVFMILSPAKTLDLTPIPLDDLDTSSPGCDKSKTLQLSQIMKSKSKKQLKDLLKVSDKISDAVKNYYEAFEIQDGDGNSNSNRKPAVFSFDGPAFKGINPSSCDSKTLTYMQTHLRIVDPLYGTLKPLDLIQPYRLEMATKAIMKDLNHDEGEDYKSLANWWKDSVTSSISSDMKECESSVLVNLASDEYAAAVDEAELSEHNFKFIKIAFQQEGKVIAVHAKRARGLMVRYVSENQLEGVDGMRNFDLEGYGFCEDKSNEHMMVFDRRKNWKEEQQESEEDSGGSKKRKVKGKGVSASKRSVTKKSR